MAGPSAGAGTAGDDPSPMDLYLAPHSDDIAFSLGALAHRRRAGTLLTILPRTGYVPTLPGQARPPVEQVTRMRMAEDARFAAASDLGLRFLDLACASALGHRSRDLGWVEQNTARIEPALMQALSGRGVRDAAGRRPWLFCPSGIGGHVDHVAIRLVVTRHRDVLGADFRLGFYEDLHYASDPAARWAGIAALMREWPGLPLRRHALPLRDGAARKLALIRLYESQLPEPPHSIGRFTPAAESTPEPHEAIWTAEPNAPA